jgi:hypothetical protein
MAAQSYDDVVNEVSRLLNDPDYLGADDEAQDPFQDRSHRAAIPDEAADMDTTPPFQTLAAYSASASAAAAASAERPAPPVAVAAAAARRSELWPMSPEMLRGIATPPTAMRRAAVAALLDTSPPSGGGGGGVASTAGAAGPDARVSSTQAVEWQEYRERERCHRFEREARDIVRRMMDVEAEQLLAEYIVALRPAHLVGSPAGVAAGTMVPPLSPLRPSVPQPLPRAPDVALLGVPRSVFDPSSSASAYESGPLTIPNAARSAASLTAEGLPAQKRRSLLKNVGGLSRHDAGTASSGQPSAPPDPLGIPHSLAQPAGQSVADERRSYVMSSTAPPSAESLGQRAARPGDKWRQKVANTPDATQPRL